MQMIKTNYYVMPDLISLPRQLVSRGHPEYQVPFFLDSPSTSLRVVSLSNHDFYPPLED